MRREQNAGQDMLNGASRKRYRVDIELQAMRMQIKLRNWNRMNLPGSWWL